MGFVDRLTGKTAAKAAKKAAEVQALGAEEASQLFDPLAQLGQTGVDQAGFLTDPTQQMDFLQNNPLFQAALQAGQKPLGNITKMAAATGRLSAGDTLETLQEQNMRNTLLAAQPLISGQKQSIADLINLGSNTATAQGNLRTGQAAATAGGLIGAENARGQGYQNIIDIGGGIAGSNVGQSLINKGLSAIGLGG